MSTNQQHGGMVHQYEGSTGKPPEDERVAVQDRYTGLHHTDGGLKLPTLLIWNWMGRSSAQWPRRRHQELIIIF